MKTVFFIISILVISGSKSQSCEYLYPVSSYRDSENRQKLLVMYQKTAIDVELWSWDPATQYAEKMLPASFAPAGVRVLPDNKGFSFIDNGRIRIKEFLKRSARSVDIQDSVSSIGLITWSSDGVGYFHAKEHHYYHIFCLTPLAEVDRCIAQSKTDCMYPLCVEGTLFYIERTEAPALDFGYQYRIMEQSRIGPSNTASPAQLCVDFQNRPIIFLTMINAHEGFVVEHASKMESSAGVINFSYHHLIRDYQMRWHHNVLFSFSIPASLVQDSDSRLYESIIPLLPRILGSDIYYVDTYHTTLAVYAYNLVTKKRENIITPSSKNDCLLVPFYHNASILCGGRVNSFDLEKRCGPRIYYDEEKNIRFSFLTISTRIKN